MLFSGQNCGIICCQLQTLVNVHNLRLCYVHESDNRWSFFRVYTINNTQVGMVSKDSIASSFVMTVTLVCLTYPTSSVE